jgi:hypothetical protein
VDDNSIGNGLGNSGDFVVLSKNSEIIVNFSYDTETGKGRSLSLIGEKYVENMPSPGEENVFIESIEQEKTGVDLSLYLILPEKSYAGSKYSLFKIKNEDYPDYNEELFVDFYYNVSGSSFYEEQTSPSLKSYTTTDTGDYVFEESGEYVVCGNILDSSIEDYNLENNKFCQSVSILNPFTVSCNVSLSIKTEKLIYNEGEKLGFYNELTEIIKMIQGLRKTL